MLAGTHLPLLVIASLSLVLFIIPSLILGIFGSVCLRFQIVSKFRPIIDAIHSPYHDHYHFWYGIRLFLLVILAVINPVLRGYNPIFQLLLQLLLVTMFTNIQAYIKPFSQKWINLLDMWCMVNVIVLIFINLYGAYGGLNAESLLFVSICVMCITTVLVFGYHTILFLGRVASCFSLCKNWKEFTGSMVDTIISKLQRPFRNNYIDIDDNNINKIQLRNSGDYSKLRESLLEDLSQ